MSDYYEQSSFDKGQEFEDFVYNKVFPRELYSVIEKTHDYATNSERYVESSHRPDFRFKCKKTQQTFFVEAKYRSSTYDSPVRLYNEEQFELHNRINQNEDTVFVALGCGGSPSNPQELYLVRIDKLLYAEPYRSRLNSHLVNGLPIVIDDLDIPKFKEDVESDSTGFKEDQDKLNDANPRRNKNKLIAIGLFLLLIIGWLVFKRSGNDPNSELQNTISEYYSTLEANNIDGLKLYLEDDVKRWYQRYDLSRDQILKDTRRYRSKYPDTKAKVDWSTYTVSETRDGSYNVSYEMDYDILGSSPKHYRLKINASWSKDFKIQSMYEEKLQ